MHGYKIWPEDVAVCSRVWRVRRKEQDSTASLLHPITAVLQTALVPQVSVINVECWAVVQSQFPVMNRIFKKWESDDNRLVLYLKIRDLWTHNHTTTWTNHKKLLNNIQLYCYSNYAIVSTSQLGYSILAYSDVWVYQGPGFTRSQCQESSIKQCF